MTAMKYLRFDSPLGQILASGSEDTVTAIALPGTWQTPTFPMDYDRGALKAARQQIEAYLIGQRRDLDFPARPIGTPFQLEVWRVLATIGFGETVTYGQLAQMMGRPGATRAVGGALRSNPLPLRLPCHRVVGAANPGGFGGASPHGQWLKRCLLELERVVLPYSKTSWCSQEACDGFETL